jgi:3-oxoacyl-[acyl-carrier-protein] synthase II
VMSRRVVITGLGAVTPLGMGARVLFDRWAAGEVGIAGGEAPCSDFDPVAALGGKMARRTDRFTQFALAASDEALAEAALPHEPERIGCVIGTGIGGIGTIEKQQDILRERGPERVSPLAVPLLMSNAAAGVVAMRHGLRGPSYGVVSACAAGAHAIGTAFRMIQSGEADAVVTGGSEAALTGLARAGFAAMGATSSVGISRPFDVRRDGFVMGEGAGVLVLEDAESAAARDAFVVGEVLGYGATSDAHHLTAPDPSGGGAWRAISLALADADVSPEDLSYVNAHGTSTELNDRSETAALKTALGDAAFGVPISSTKSAIGHLLGAAGAVEAITTMLVLSNRIAPPTLGLEEPEPGLDLDYIPGAARPLGTREPALVGASTNGASPPRPVPAPTHAPDSGTPGRLIGMSNSFGFGGHNAVLVFGSV